MIHLTPLQKTMLGFSDLDERATEANHVKPVELADWLTVLAYRFGSDVVVDSANEVADALQEAK